MLILITYDVNTETREGRRRLNRMAKACLNFGQRVQKSVFECLVDPTQLAQLRQRLLKEVDVKEDSLRFYFLGKNWKPRIEHVGINEPYDPEGPLIT